jgi:N-acetylmuramoyl-L-alanine amidase
VTYHQGARRLFISLNGITYKTQFNNGNPPKLILSFSSPVNPMIATEPGRLRMTFTRDPLVASEASATTFNAKAITSAIFEENNGAATITVTGAVPLMASFGNDGRIITIATAPIAPSAQAAVTPPPPTGAATSPPSPSALSIPTVPAAAQPASQPPAHTFALIDASHGGSEPGATFSDKLVEKDINLAFARRIRQELESRGVSASLLRDSDVTLTTDQRAGMANAMRPAIYICIHAAADGKGTRVYTAIFSASGPSAGPFSPWDQAQVPSLSLSQITATSAATELGRTFAARPLSASIHPLENVTAPAIALEVSPRNGNVEDLTAEDYQQQVGAAVANAIASIKDKLGAPQ